MIAMLSSCSSFTVLSDMLSYKIPNSLLLRGQNKSCVFQQQEAGVTPEARRDRAAILRHDGVAPAHFGVFSTVTFVCISSLTPALQRNCSRHRLKNLLKTKLKGVVLTFFT